MTGILGHDRPRRALAELLAGGRLAHAYLFTGVGGVGKKRVALELARAFLCVERRGCGECPSCLAVDSLRHPDLLFLHDFQSLRWEDRDRLERRLADSGDLTAAVEELRAADLLLAPTTSVPESRRLGFTLDPGHIYKTNVLDPSPFADRLAKMEERGKLSPAGRRLASTLYFDETSRMSYRGTLWIHLVTHREMLTPDRGSMRDFLGRTSTWGRGKVVVVDDAHLMNEEAQNALLKTLEEPPPGTLLLLVTDDPDRLEPTIRSRTQQVRFGRLSPEILAEALRNQGASPGVADFIAAWADGSLGRALEGDLEGLSSRRDRAIQLHHALMAGDIPLAMGVAALFSSADEESPDRVRRHRRMARDLELVMLWYRDLAVAATHGPRARLLNADLAPRIAREAGTRPAEAWQIAFGIVSRTLSSLRLVSDFRLQAEDMVARLLLAAS